MGDKENESDETSESVTKGKRQNISADENGNRLKVPENPQVIEELLGGEAKRRRKSAPRGNTAAGDVSMNVNILNPFGSIVELARETTDDGRRKSSLM